MSYRRECWYKMDGIRERTSPLAKVVETLDKSMSQWADNLQD